MRTNRSVPPTTVIPALAYADVGEAGDWFCRDFRFTERLRIGDPGSASALEITLAR